jgi:transketolase
MASGSEVWLAVAAARLLEEAGTATRVVSLPAPQAVAHLNPHERDALLPPRGRRVSIEAGVTDYWHRFVGPEGLAIGIDRFGESAPYAALQEHFGFTPERVAKRVTEWFRL